jgi:hypothetical protein
MEKNAKRKKSLFNKEDKETFISLSFFFLAIKLFFSFLFKKKLLSK